mgnify:FL=1
MGRLLVKTGVDFGVVLAPAGARMLDVLKRLVAGYPFDITITSARDGVHSGPGDPHHSGEAFDLRTKPLTDPQKATLLTDLRETLYKTPRKFWVDLEAPGQPYEHIHVQRRKGVTYTVVDYLNNS